jgi:hypothetical protein
MLVETLVAIHLRSRVLDGPAPPWTEAVASFLLDGPLRPVVTEPELSTGAVVARLHRWVKGVDPAARATAGDGALDAFETLAEAPPGEELHAVPPPWSDGLLGGTVHLAFRTGGLAAAAHARFALRSRGAVPPLRVVIRGVRADLLPADGEDPTYAQDLGKALRRKGAFADLRDLLVRDAEAAGRSLGAAFADAVDAPVAVRTRVRLLERMSGAEDLLRGLPAGAAREVAALADWFRLLRPGVEVVRHRWDGGVELWRGEVVGG